MISPVASSIPFRTAAPFALVLVLMMKDTVGQPLGFPLDNLPTPIRRCIINHDDFPLHGCRQWGMKDGLKQLVEGVALVVNGYDNAQRLACRFSCRHGNPLCLNQRLFMVGR